MKNYSCCIMLYIQSLHLSWNLRVYGMEGKKEELEEEEEDGNNNVDSVDNAKTINGIAAEDHTNVHEIVSFTVIYSICAVHKVGLPQVDFA